jgi:hypothetical protein
MTYIKHPLKPDPPIVIRLTRRVLNEISTAFQISLFFKNRGLTWKLYVFQTLQTRCQNTGT